MKVDRRDLERNLPRKGFRKDDSGDHVFFYHEYEGRQTGPWTKVSHTQKMRDITGDLLNAVKRQLRLDTNRQVKDLCECPIDGDEYNRILIAKGVFDPDE